MTTPEPRERNMQPSGAQRAEWLIYAAAAFAGVGYVGPWLGQMTGYYEGLFSLGFVVAVIAAVHLFKFVYRRKSGDSHAVE